MTKRSDNPGWKRQEWNDFGYVAGPDPTLPLAAGASYTRRESARAPVKEDVIVPVAWALATGVALGFLSVVLVWIWPGIFPLWTPLVAGLGFTGLTWIFLMLDWKRMLWRFEEITGTDLDRDGTKGEPRNRKPFPVEWTDPKNKKIELHYWPVPEEKVREVGEALRRGVALSKRELARHTSLSEDAALELLRFMRSKAYAVYIDGNTTVLTGRGEYFFKQLLAE